MTQEKSLTAALSELQTLEENRLAEEQREAELKSQPEQLALAAECAGKKRVSELKRCERNQADVSERNLEVETRIAALQSELAAVQLAREEIRLRLLASVQTSNTGQHPSLLRWKLACFLALFTTLTLLVLHWVSAGDSPTDTKTTERIESIQTDKYAKEDPLNSSEAVHKIEKSIEPPRNLHSDREPIFSNKPVSKPKTSTKHRDHSLKKPFSADDILSDLDSCEDDPTCGLSGKEMER